MIGLGVIGNVLLLSEVRLVWAWLTAGHRPRTVADVDVIDGEADI